MPTPKPVICDTIARQLHDLIADPWVQVIADQHVLWTLKEQLNNASIVPDNQLSSSVVTINSLVTLQFLESPHVETLQLVFPKDANILSARLSVLTPIGVAILGRQSGETVTTQATSGSRQVTITEVEHCKPEIASSIPLTLASTAEIPLLSLIKM